MKTYQALKFNDMGKLGIYLKKKVGVIIGAIMLLTSISGYSQTCEVTLRNDSLLDANNLVVDIYVRATSGSFYYAQGQYKISFNTAILNGGVLTGSIVAGYSDLTNSVQLPASILVGSTSWRATSGTIPGTQAECSQISATGIGTRICRVRLTNTAAFASNAADMLVVTTAPNATAVWYSDAGGYSQPTSATMVNTNLVNPVLNGTLTAFNVTGGGTAPAAVGLSSSQADGVNYILYKDGEVSGSAVTGTGSAISFGNQTAGVYTVRAHRIGTYMYSNMNGSATVTAACVGVSVTSHPSNAAVCAGATTSFTVAVSGTSPYTYQWQYYNGSTWNSVVNGTPTGAVYTNSTTATLGVSGITGAGSYQYHCYITNCSGSNNATSNAATLTVNAIPTITGTTSASRCGTGTVTLSATASAGTINWYAASTGGTSLGTGSSYTTPSLSTTTTYYVDATNNGCTTASRTAVIATINTIPTITGTAPASRCGTGTVTLGATASAGTINWYAASTGGTSLGTGTSYTTPSLSATTTYYVDATNNGCTTASRTAITATINTIPTITGTAPASRCGTGTVTLGATASAGTVNWYAASSGGTSLGTGTTFTTPSISSTTTYYVDATSGSCTTLTRTAVVATVNTVPAAPVYTIDCSLGFGHGVVTVTSPTGAGYEYRLDAGTYQTSTSFSDVANGSHTITVRNSAGCTTTGSSFDVSCGCVNGPTVALSTTSGSTCGTTAVTVTNNTFGGSATNVMITENGTGTVSPGTATVSPFSFTYTPGAGDAGTIVTITVTTNNPLGAPCAAATATYSLTVNAVPTITGATSASRCGPGTVTLGATASAGTINWYAASTGGTTLGTGTSYTTPSLSSTTTYYVDATNNGCTTASRTAVTATINAIPTITGTTPASRCGTGTVTLSATASAGTINWYSASTGGTSLGTGGSFTTPSIGATTTYYVDATNNGCTTASRTAVIATVNSLPVVNAGTDQTIPNGTSTTLTGTVTGASPFTYSWTPAGQVVTPASLSTNTVNLSSTTTFTLTATSNTTSCSNSDQVVVNITGGALGASATATPNPVCAGASMQLAANATGGSGSYTYTWSSNPAGFSSSLANPTVSPAVNTTYYVTVNDGFNSANSQVSVTVNPIPAAPTVNVTQPTCAVASGTITVTAPTGTGMTYSINGTTYTNTTGIFSSVAPGTYTVTARSAAGCTSSGSSATVNDQPPTPVVGNQTSSIATGGTFTVTPSGVPVGTTYTWPVPTYTNGVTGGVAQSTGSPNISGTLTIPSGAGTAVYTVTPTSGSCVGNTFTVTVTVTSSCTAVAISAHPAAASMCVGGNTTLTVTAGGTSPFVYQWQYNNGTSWVAVTDGTPTGAVYSNASTATLGISVISVTGTYQYRCYITNCGGGNTATSNSANLTVNALPAAPAVGTITQPTCTVSTGSVVLSSLPAGSWTINPGNRTGSGSSVTITNLTPGSYSFTITNSSGCTSSASTEVVINTQPAVPTRPVSGTVTQPTCAVSTGSVGLSGLPSTGTWTLRRYPGGAATPGTGETTVVSSLNPGTYNFSVENEGGCVSPLSDNVVINAQPVTPTAPTVGAITHPTYTVPTGSVVLGGMQSGLIIRSNPVGVEVVASGSAMTISGLEPGTYTFTITNSSGCTSLPSGQVVINPRPGTPTLVITNPAAICSNQTTDLTLPAITVGSEAGLTFTYWTDALATVVYSTPAAATPGTYYIKGTNTQDFYAIKPVIVAADQLPVANAGPDQVLDFVFGTNLNAEIPESGAGIWELVTGAGELFNSTSPSTAVTGLGIGNNEFSWTVTNGACPPVKDFVVIKVNDLLIPTLITPNGDGRNDFFVLRGIESMGRTELIIFDRRGLKVYENTDYDNSWEGLDYNGNPLPDDTYFYVIRSESVHPLSGYIVIRR